MKSKKTRRLLLGIALLTLFAAWTAVVLLVDVKPVGVNGTDVGLASLNTLVHAATGVRMSLYTLTDWLGLIPLAVVFAFGVLGLGEWVKRRSLKRVDRSLFVLGAFYLAVFAAYLFFEVTVINYRPVLIEGRLEASYPSSTTMLALCVMPTAAMQLRARVQNALLRRCITSLIIAFTFFMVAARLLSGVHWLSDIIGGALFSGGLVTLYAVFATDAADKTRR